MQMYDLLFFIIIFDSYINIKFLLFDILICLFFILVKEQLYYFCFKNNGELMLPMCYLS